MNKDNEKEHNEQSKLDEARVFSGSIWGSHPRPRVKEAIQEQEIKNRIKGVDY